MNNKQKRGKAYAFIYSSASEREIKDYLPLGRERANVHSSLELEIRQGINPKEFNEDELVELAESALNIGNNYTMKAGLKDATNERTANELGDLLNEFYQSPLQENFLKDGGYYGWIVYEENGRYQFKE